MRNMKIFRYFYCMKMKKKYIFSCLFRNNERKKKIFVPSKEEK